MTVVSPIPLGGDEELNRQIILNIFSSIGRCRFLEEKHFDACTALSGSGPAFACIVIEAMADGGVMMGLPRAEALELAAQSKLLFCILQACSQRIRQLSRGQLAWRFSQVHILRRFATRLQVRYLFCR